MKKLIKKIEIKPLLTTIGLVLFQLVSFYANKLFQGEAHIVGSFIDDAIPFNAWFILPYYAWYLLIFIVPYYAYLKDKSKFIKYAICYIVITVISNIVFLAYPSMVIRPEFETTGILTFLTNFIYWIDNPAINCLPSLHCAISMLFVLVICTMKKANIKFKIFVFIMSVLIMFSTLFTKQHVFIDLVTGDVLALVVYVIFMNNKKIVKKVQELLKL